MSRFSIPISLVAAGLMSATTAAAQCVTVDPVIIPQIRADPLDGSGPDELVQPFYISFRRASLGSDPISIRYQIVDEDSAAIARVGLSQGPAVQWTSSDASREIGALRQEAYALLRTGVVSFDSGEVVVQRQHTLRLSDLRSELPAGIYREQFSVRFWCEMGETGIPYESTGVVAVSVAVPNVLSASVAGASTTGAIDFGGFEALARSLQVSVRSTGPFKLTARSENGGALLREGSYQTVTPSDRISYRASFAGEFLSTDGTVSPVLPRAGLAGRQIPLDVVVSDVTANRAGIYKDTLYLTLEPAN